MQQASVIIYLTPTRSTHMLEQFSSFQHDGLSNPLSHYAPRQNYSNEFFYNMRPKLSIFIHYLYASALIKASFIPTCNLNNYAWYNIIITYA